MISEQHGPNGEYKSYSTVFGQKLISHTVLSLDKNFRFLYSLDLKEIDIPTRILFVCTCVVVVIVVTTGGVIIVMVFLIVLVIERTR
jgi:hypothetical protein